MNTTFVRRLWPPRKNFLDIVTWLVTTLGALGLVIAVVQSPLVLFVDTFRGMRQLWALFVVQSVVLLTIGPGLRFRKPWARRALVVALSAAILHHLCLVAALVTRHRFPLVPAILVETDLYRWPGTASALFWSIVYGWVAVRLLRPEVAAQFTGPRHDV